MKGKLLVVDLDGTLLVNEGDKKIVSENDRQKISEFVAKGGEMVVATGRLDHDIVAVEKMIGITGQYRISVNGSSIRNSKNEIVFEKKVETEVIKEVSDYMFKHCPRVEFADSDFRYYREPRPKEFLGELVVGRERILPDLQNEIGKSVFPLVAITFDKTFDYRPIKKYFLDNYDGRMDTFMTAPVALEVVAKGVSKGSGLQKVMEWMGILPENTYTIGDSESDISMFKVTPHSFAMAEALDYVRKASVHVVPTVGECVEFILKN